jgi:hypothetical protein
MDAVFELVFALGGSVPRNAEASTAKVEMLILDASSATLVCGEVLGTREKPYAES